MIKTEIMDDGSVSYKLCSEVDMLNRDWERYYFGVASKNYREKLRQPSITNIDIHMIQFSLLDKELMPAPAKLEAERYKLLLTRKSMLSVESGKLIGDVDELFQKGIAHEVKTQQRKNLALIDIFDSTN